MDKLAVRIFTSKKERRKNKNFKRPDPPLNHNRVLVFDTETTTCQYQNLKVGYFTITQNRDSIYKGFFYESETVNDKELKVLKRDAKKRNVSLYTKDDFVNEVFYPEVYSNKTLCVGFNLPFDLSRLCVNFGYARNSGKGGFSLQLSHNPFCSRIKVKQMGNSYDIKFAKALEQKYTFEGYFIDLQTLSKVFTSNKKISLKEACKTFNTTHQKIDGAEHGKITSKYIEYLVNDVVCTWELYQKLIEEYNNYNINLPPTKIYSKASLGKQALKQMGITPFLEQNPNFPKEILGKIMSAYFGGRCECLIRKTPVKVTTLDFTSMYPTMICLMDLWTFIIANKIKYVDCIEEVKKLLKNITLEKLTKKKIWKKLNILVGVKPEGDVLPVRTKYRKDTYNIGLNYLTYNSVLYYALPDVIASVLLTGKVPKIVEAIKFIPVGKQSTLTSAKILGFDINPRKDNFTKKLIELRHQVKTKMKQYTNKQEKTSLDNEQKALKILANAGSYGIFVETNPTEVDETVNVYSSKSFTCYDNKFESAGSFFNPLVAVCLTAGARLLLAMAEVFLKYKGSTHYYMDTDSCYVTPEIAQELSEFFQPLNPYKFNTPLFKIEKENSWFYGISAKRYVLYKLKKDKIIIEEDCDDYKLHGLGHIRNPFNDAKEKWHKTIWEDILKLHYKKISEEQIINKYSSSYTLSKLTVTTPVVMNRFKNINKKTTGINKMIKPFNFFLTGMTNNGIVKPITPFNHNPQSTVHEPFIDYESGRIMQGLQYWKPLSDTILDYINHSESKLKGNTGLLKRKHVKPKGIIYIGKEANKIETQQLEQTQPNKYTNPEEIKQKILKTTPAQAKTKGVSRQTLWKIKQKIKQNKNYKLTKTILKLTP